MFGSPEVGSPKLVVIVGSLGLLSNIVGLFLFHEHGHGHGGGGHSHGHSHDAVSEAEQGHSHSHSHSAKKSKKTDHKHANGVSHTAKANGNGSANVEADERSPLLPPSAVPRAVSQKGSETPFEDEPEDTLEDLLVHPARTREAIVRQAYDAGFGSPRNSAETGLGHRRSMSVQSQQRRLQASQAKKGATSPLNERSEEHDHAHDHENAADGHSHEHDHDHSDEDEHDHAGHDHSHGDEGGHGHSHGNMNMQGVFLHVLGDAVRAKLMSLVMTAADESVLSTLQLGNVGVIGAGLVIWLTKSPYRFYADPIISFIITVIIFSSALPLVRSASFILLQGTPSHVPLEKVRSAILRIPNVISVHDLHIWSLSESKLVASMHILVKSHAEFTACSNEVRALLHRFGVHSSTIQPELLEQGKAASERLASRAGSTHGGSNAGDAQLALGTTMADVEQDDGTCTVQCVDDSCVDSACCPPAVVIAQKSTASLRLGDA